MPNKSKGKKRAITRKPDSKKERIHQRRNEKRRGTDRNLPMIRGKKRNSGKASIRKRRIENDVREEVFFNIDSWWEGKNWGWIREREPWNEKTRMKRGMGRIEEGVGGSCRQWRPLLHTSLLLVNPLRRSGWIRQGIRIKNSYNIIFFILLFAV